MAGELPDRRTDTKRTKERPWRGETCVTDVRFGSLADVGAALADVCSWGSSRHSILQLRFGVPGWREFDEIAALSQWSRKYGLICGVAARRRSIITLVQ